MIGEKRLPLGTPPSVCGPGEFQGSGTLSWVLVDEWEVIKQKNGQRAFKYNFFYFLNYFYLFFGGGYV